MSALLVVLQRQRDEANNRLANAEAQGAVLSAENEALRKTIEEMRSSNESAVDAKLDHRKSKS